MTAVEDGSLVLGDRYELQQLIATGGMGQVWRGHDRLLDRAVAVKVLRSEYAVDPTFAARFRAEAQHAAALHHPNIAAVLDYGETTAADTGETVAFLVMELVEGSSLSALLSAEGRLAPDAALSVLSQAAAALAEAHRSGLVHRDVKPANILVRPDGGVKLTDFGIAWSAASVPLTRTGQVIGTPQYMSPEQAEGHGVSPASDVYALGLVGYETLAGHAAFDGDNPVTVALKQVREQPEPLPADLPAPVRSLIESALTKDPHERIPDGRAFLDAIEETIDSTPVDAGPATRPVPVRPHRGGPVPGAGAPPRRRTALVVLAAVLAVLVVAGLGAALLDRSPAPSEGTATAEEPAAATGIVLDVADHVGRPAEDVVAQLTALGLVVTTRERTTADRPAGTVVDVGPAGVRLEEGDAVVVTVAVAPSAPAEEPAAPAPVDVPAVEVDDAQPAPAPEPVAEPGTSAPASDTPPATVPPPTDATTPEPGTTAPGTTDPGTTDPGTTGPGTTGPGTTDPGTTDPGTTDPGTTDPGTTDPGTTDPGTTDPGTTDPGTSAPAGTTPAPGDPAAG